MVAIRRAAATMQQAAPADSDDDTGRHHDRRFDDERNEPRQRSDPLRLAEDAGEHLLGRLTDVVVHRRHEGSREDAIVSGAHVGRSRMAIPTRSGSSPSDARNASSPRWSRDFAVPTGTSSTAAAWTIERSR